MEPTASQAQFIMDILHRFVHLQIEETSDSATGKKRRKETLIFPRANHVCR
jgi:hypothetical protein